MADAVRRELRAILRRNVERFAARLEKALVAAKSALDIDYDELAAEIEGEDLAELESLADRRYRAGYRAGYRKAWAEFVESYTIARQV